MEDSFQDTTDENTARTNSETNSNDVKKIPKDEHDIDNEIPKYLQNIETNSGPVVATEYSECMEDKLKVSKCLHGNKDLKINDELTNNTNNNLKKTNREPQKNKIEIETNSHKMRLQVLTLELNVIETYVNKKLIEDDNQTLKKLQDMNLNIDMNSEDLLKGEDLSNELMKNIKRLITKKTVNKKEGNHPTDDIDVPDYRSIVTVRGTENDVKNCILKANIAMESGHNDKAERLLLKAERIFPTKNARVLLQKIREVKDLKLNLQPIEQVTEAEEPLNTVREDNSRWEDNIINGDKCLTAFKQALMFGDLRKAERMLNKAKRFNPSLNTETELSSLKVAIINNKLCERLQLLFTKLNSVEETTEINDHAFKTRIHDTKIWLGNIKIALKRNYLEKAEHDLYLVEKSFEELKFEFEEVRDKKAKTIKKETRSEDDMEHFNNISKVTEDHKDIAANCIQKARTALDNENFKKAENLLMKAERIHPTQSAKDLLKQVQAKKEPKQKLESAAQAAAAEEQVNIKPVFEDDLLGAKRCLIASEEAYTSSNLIKAYRMLSKAKRLDPSLYLEEKLSFVNSAITNQEETEKALSECKTAGECLYKSVKAYTAGGFTTAGLFLLNTKKFEPNWDIEPEMLNIKAKAASNHVDKNQGVFKTGSNVRTVNKGDIICAGDSLFEAKKAYHAGRFWEVERYLNNLKIYDPALNFVPYFSKFYADKASRSSTEPNYSHGIASTSRTQFSFSENENPNTINLQKKTEKYIYKEQEKSKVIKTAELNNDETFEAQKEMKKYGVNNTTQNVSEWDADFKPHEVSTVERQAENSESQRHEEIFKYANSKITTGKKQHSTVLQNGQQKNIDNIQASTTNVLSNCYKYPVKDNESDIIEASNCLEIADAAFKKGEYKKAEHFLLKSQRIRNSQDTHSYLQIVRSATAQKHGNKASTSKTIKSEDATRRGNEAELYVELALGVISQYRFRLARYYLKRALEFKSDEHTKGLVRDLQIQIEETEKQLKIHRGSDYLTQKDEKLEAHRLLGATQKCVTDGDIEKAEFLLTVSWDLHKSEQTILIYRNLVTAQIAQLSRKEENRFNRREKQIQSCKLVESAIEMYSQNQFKQARQLLMKATELYSNVLLDKLLVDVNTHASSWTYKIWSAFWN